MKQTNTHKEKLGAIIDAIANQKELMSYWKAFEICFEEKLLEHASLLSYSQFLGARIRWPLPHIPLPWRAETRTLEVKKKKKIRRKIMFLLFLKH